MRIRSGNVELRQFDASLTEAVHAIRNHPSVREHMRDPRPIARASHERWVEENLLQAQRLQLFVVFRKEQAIGIALLRDFHGAEAEIGLMMVEPTRWRMAGYIAAHLLGYYAFEVLGLERLLSKVPIHNRAALEFNVNCGFEASGQVSDVYQILFLSKTQSREHSTHKRFRASRKIDVD
jgi:RimJ/RimL family protein N-acetyltransferase